MGKPTDTKKGKQHPPKQHKTRRGAKVAKAARKMGALSLNTRKAEKSGSAKQIAYFLMNPSGSPAQRLATPFDGSPSSVITLFNQVSITMPTIVGTYDLAGITAASGIFQAFYFRCPLRSMVLFRPNQAAYEYRARFSATVHGVVDGNQSTPIIQRADENISVVPLFYTWWNGPSVHGTLLFCGRDEESGKEGYVWIDYGATLIATQSVANTADAVNFYAYTSGRDALLATKSFASSKAELDLSSLIDDAARPRGAYVRVEYLTGSTPSASQGVSLVIKTDSPSDVFAHHAVPGAWSHLDDFSMARVNSSSLLLQNSAAPMYKEGTLQAASFEKGMAWNDAIGAVDLTSMVNSRNAYRGALAKGSYSYLHVSERSELDYKEYVRHNRLTGAVENCSFLMNDNRFVAITAITAQVGASFPGYDFFVQHTSSLEFQTSDQWYNARVSSTPSAEVVAALDLVKLETQFFCNPSHLAQIGNFLNGAGRMLKRHAGKIGGALSVLFPAYSAVFNALGNAIHE